MEDWTKKKENQENRNSKFLFVFCYDQQTHEMMIIAKTEIGLTFFFITSHLLTTESYYCVGGVWLLHSNNVSRQSWVCYVVNQKQETELLSVVHLEKKGEKGTPFFVVPPFHFFFSRNE